MSFNTTTKSNCREEVEEFQFAGSIHLKLKAINIVEKREGGRFDTTKSVELAHILCLVDKSSPVRKQK